MLCLQRILMGLPTRIGYDAAKKLLVTGQSSPIIPDGDFALCFRRSGVVKRVVGQSYAFNHQIDTGLRSIILLLNEDVEEKDISGFMIMPYFLLRVGKTTKY